MMTILERQTVARVSVDAAHRQGIFRQQLELNPVMHTVHNETLSLPVLPPIKREFAFRFATETKTNQEWAVLYSTTIDVIRTWQAYRKVQEYVGIIQASPVIMKLERNQILENRAYKRLSDILHMPLADDNADMMRKTVLDSISLGRGTVPQSGGAGVQIINQQGMLPAPSLASIRNRIDELSQLEEVIGIE